MRNCPQCNTPLADSDKFCIACGANTQPVVMSPPPLAPQPEHNQAQDNPPHHSHKGLFIGIGLCTVAVIGAVVAFCISNATTARKQSELHQQCVSSLEQVHSFYKKEESSFSSSQKLLDTAKKASEQPSNIDDLSTALEDYQTHQKNAQDIECPANESSQQLQARIDEATLALQTARDDEQTLTHATSEVQENIRVQNKSAEQEKKKEERAKKQQKTLNNTSETYTNDRFDFSVDIPKSFTWGPASTNGDGRWFTNNDLDMKISVLASERDSSITLEETKETEEQGLDITYESDIPSGFVLSWQTGDSITYKRVEFGRTPEGLAVRYQLLFEYGTAHKDECDAIVERVAPTFKCPQ